MLSDNQQTAERTGSKGGKGSAYHGIVMSRDPMQVNRLYEVSLSQALNNNKYNYYYNNIITMMIRIMIIIIIIMIMIMTMMTMTMVIVTEL